VGSGNFAFHVAYSALSWLVQLDDGCLQESLTSAVNATGVDVNSLSRTTAVVSKTATEGVTAAQPFVSKAITFLTTTEPVRAAHSSTATFDAPLDISLHTGMPAWRIVDECGRWRCVGTVSPNVQGW
jgi:hypothetical protein